LLYLVCFFDNELKKDATSSVQYNPVNQNSVTRLQKHPLVDEQTDAIGAMKDADASSAFHTPCNAASCQIVGGQHNSHLIAWYDTHKVHSDTP